MKNRLKGMVLVVAIMIATIVLIMLGGLFTVVGTGVRITGGNVDRTRLYYAAESGINYGLYWLKSISMDSLNRKVTAPGVAQGFNNQNLNFTINGATVRIYTSVDTISSTASTIWNMVSRAELNGDSCIIRYRNIIPRSPFDHCYFNEKSGALGGFFTTDQNFYGKTYFNGEIAMHFTSGQMPTFYGEVESHYNVASKSSGGTGVDFNNSSLSSYKYGLYVSKNGGTTMNNSTLLSGLNSDAFPFGYSQNVPKQPLQAMTYSWDDLKSKTVFPASKLITDLPGMGTSGIVRITFTEDSAGSTASGAKFIKVENGGNSAYIRQNANTKIFCIPKAYGDVYVSGVVHSDISIVTENDNVVINGDLYSKGHETFADRRTADFSPAYTLANTSHPINQIMAVTQYDYNVGIIVGVGSNTGAGTISKPNLYINQKGITKSSDYDVILVTAGIYTPKGDLTWFATQPNSTATGTTALSWSKLTRLILYGGFIGLTEAQTQTSTVGFSPNYINSPKFIGGNLPPGFKPAIELDPVTNLPYNMFSDGFDWSITWK